ncbi:unnamed protein product [Trifolium pratense]|uniref:Uncharacterized protein n=1 Tax=Trifolium pratense TaxID=57577 RepID=A0ACB0J4V1_TRIPR|nr:unnamed protein product [Trifolium pratense]
MAEIIKFVCFMIIFLFLIFVAKNVEATRCYTDADCPKDSCPKARTKPKCVAFVCRCVPIIYPDK